MTKQSPAIPSLCVLHSTMRYNNEDIILFFFEQAVHLPPLSPAQRPVEGNRSRPQLSSSPRFLPVLTGTMWLRSLKSAALTTYEGGLQHLHPGNVQQVSRQDGTAVAERTIYLCPDTLAPFELADLAQC